MWQTCFFFHLTKLPQIPTVGIASWFAARARNLQLLSNPLAKQWHICILHPQRELVYSALYFQLPSSLATSLCTYVWHAPLPATVNRKGGFQGSPTDKSNDLRVLTRAGWPTKKSMLGHLLMTSGRILYPLKNWHGTEKKQRYGRWCSFSIEKFLSSMLNFRGVFFFSLLPCFKYIPCCQALLHATASATKETESANSCLTQKLIRKLMGLKYLENSLSNDLDTPVMMVKITWSSCAMIQWWFISYEAIESSQQDSRIVPIRAITQID